MAACAAAAAFPQLSAFGRNQPFELLILRAGRAAANRFDVLKVATCFGDIALRNIKCARITPCADVIGVGSKRLVVPGARLGQISKLGVRESDRVRDIRVVVIASDFIAAAMNTGPYRALFLAKFARARSLHNAGQWPPTGSLWQSRLDQLGPPGLGLLRPPPPRGTLPPPPPPPPRPGKPPPGPI